MISVTISNQSDLFDDKDLPTLANALQLQISRDYFPAYGVNAKIFYATKGMHPTASHWVVALLDDSDQSDALAYHDTTPTGQPLGKAFVRTTLAAGDQVSVTVSHEILEVLGDAYCNLTTQSGSKLFAFENCDAVQSDACGYEITIPVGWPGAGSKVLVSDFVYPSWFQPGMVTGPFDFMNKVTAPLQLAQGGYIGYLDLNHLAQGWQQSTAETDSPRARMQARPHPGSRRSRRAIPKDQWIKSSYIPGTVATAAGIIK